MSNKNENGIPLKTIKEGEKITKVCVEDVYKIINRVTEAMDKAYNDSIDVFNSLEKTYEDNGKLWKGYFIIGTGISQPCEDDVFNEKIGNEIAFKKAKLNANIKKVNTLYRIVNIYHKVFSKLYDEIIDLNDYIDKDIDDLREFNPNYLSNYEV